MQNGLSHAHIDKEEILCTAELRFFFILFTENTFSGSKTTILADQEVVYPTPWFPWEQSSGFLKEINVVKETSSDVGRGDVGRGLGWVGEKINAVSSSSERCAEIEPLTSFILVSFNI